MFDLASFMVGLVVGVGIWVVVEGYVKVWMEERRLRIERRNVRPAGKRETVRDV